MRQQLKNQIEQLQLDPDGWKGEVAKVVEQGLGGDRVDVRQLVIGVMDKVAGGSWMEFCCPSPCSARAAALEWPAKQGETAAEQVVEFGIRSIACGWEAHLRCLAQAVVVPKIDRCSRCLRCWPGPARLTDRPRDQQGPKTVILGAGLQSTACTGCRLKIPRKLLCSCAVSGHLR